MFWIKEESSALVRIRFVRWNFWISGRFPSDVYQRQMLLLVSSLIAIFGIKGGDDK